MNQLTIVYHWIVSEFFQKTQKKLENSSKIKHYSEYL